MSKALPHRSWLFVPGDRPERFCKAISSHADAVILDLEDGVAQWNLEAAIANVDAFLTDRSAGEVSIWVRIDDAVSRRPAIQRLARHNRLDGFVIPKFERPEQCAGWDKPVLAIIETPLGVVNAARIAQAAAQDLYGIALGPEDLSTALGVSPSLPSLIYAASTVAFAAHAAGVWAYSSPGSIGEFKDLDAWRATLVAGRQIGSKGALCIHPSQVGFANQAFSPSEAEIEWAIAVCAAWEGAEGKGVISIDGKMIDLPIVMRAKDTLSRQRTGFACGVRGSEFQ
jgi:citrate lyase subunit beta / citryl-CoA lyase